MIDYINPDDIRNKLIAYKDAGKPVVYGGKFSELTDKFITIFSKLDFIFDLHAPNGYHRGLVMDDDSSRVICFEVTNEVMNQILNLKHKKPEALL
jgi:hypothetical protein